MRWSEEKMDQVMFDYLEGDLTVQEQLAFDSELQSNSSLAEELENWQVTHVQCDFYDTTALEANLVLKTNPFTSFRFYLNTVLIIAVSFVSNTQMEVYPKIIPERMTVPETGIVAKVPVSGLESGLLELSKPTSLSSLNPVIRPMEKKVETYALKSDDFQRIESLPVHFEDFLLLPENVVSIKKVKEPVEKLEKDRRTIRYLSRMKNKALRDRKAAEFMKGNVPYVVPIDTENF